MKISRKVLKYLSQRERDQHSNIVSILQASFTTDEDSTKHHVPLVVSPVVPDTSKREIEKDIESAMIDYSWVSKCLQIEASSEEKSEAVETVRSKDTT